MVLVTVELFPAASVATTRRRTLNRFRRPTSRLGGFSLTRRVASEAPRLRSARTRSPTRATAADRARPSSATSRLTASFGVIRAVTPLRRRLSDMRRGGPLTVSAGSVTSGGGGGGGGVTGGRIVSERSSNGSAPIAVAPPLPRSTVYRFAAPALRRAAYATPVDEMSNPA